MTLNVLAADRSAADVDPRERLPAALLGELAEWVGQERLTAVLGALRHPDAIMTPEALSAMKSCSLSLLQTLLQRMAAGQWDFRRRRIEVDEIGNGVAVYDLSAEGYDFTLVVRACWDGEEKPGRRMDHTADFLTSVVAGVADDALVAREVAAMAIPHWGGRADPRSYGWTAANRSQKSFAAVVDALAVGGQPDLDRLAADGGYVIRNAGFYGNGRAGALNWLSIPAQDHPFSVPYHMDLFLMFMWREVGLDFVEAIAACRSARAVRLDARARHYIGVGNSSGLGMTCALVRWPQWVNSWVLTREMALAYAKVSTVSSAGDGVLRLQARLARAIRYYTEVPGPEHGLTTHAVIVADLGHTLRELEQWLAAAEGERQWGEFCEMIEHRVGPDAQEQFFALLIDLYPDFVAKLAGTVSAAMRRGRAVVPEMTLGALKALIRQDYDWALKVDRSDPESAWHFWYHSEEAGEQRRGERAVDPCLEFETFVDVIGPVQDCYRILTSEEWPDNESTARFTLAHPELAYIVGRMQFLHDQPYGEIRGNLIARSFQPIRVIRFFLSIFGFESGSPRSVAWVRGVLLQGCPSPDDIRAGHFGDWVMPLKPSLEATPRLESLA